jgi:hypothetical protein
MLGREAEEQLSARQPKHAADPSPTAGWRAFYSDAALTPAIPGGSPFGHPCPHPRVVRALHYFAARKRTTLDLRLAGGLSTPMLR